MSYNQGYRNSHSQQYWSHRNEPSTNFNDDRRRSPNQDHRWKYRDTTKHYTDSTSNSNDGRSINKVAKSGQPYKRSRWSSDRPNMDIRNCTPSRETHKNLTSVTQKNIAENEKSHSTENSVTPKKNLILKSVSKSNKKDEAAQLLNETPPSSCSDQKKPGGPLQQSMASNVRSSRRDSLSRQSGDESNEGFLKQLQNDNILNPDSGLVSNIQKGHVDFYPSPRHSPKSNASGTGNNAAKPPGHHNMPKQVQISNSSGSARTQTNPIRTHNMSLISNATGTGTTPANPVECHNVIPASTTSGSGNSMASLLKNKSMMNLNGLVLHEGVVIERNTSRNAQPTPIKQDKIVPTEQMYQASTPIKRENIVPNDEIYQANQPHYPNPMMSPLKRENCADNSHTNQPNNVSIQNGIITSTESISQTTKSGNKAPSPNQNIVSVQQAQFTEDMNPEPSTSSICNSQERQIHYLPNNSPGSDFVFHIPSKRRKTINKTAKLCGKSVKKTSLLKNPIRNKLLRQSKKKSPKLTTASASPLQSNSSVGISEFTIKTEPLDDQEQGLNGTDQVSSPALSGGSSNLNMNALQALMDQMKCQTCKSWVTLHEIRSCFCRLLCENCAINTPGCLTCGKLMEPDLRLANFHSRLAKIVPHPCRNHKNGCTQQLQPEDSDHETFCTFKTVLCYGCKSTMAFNNIENHFRAVHPNNRVLELNNNNVLPTDFMTIRRPSGEPGESYIFCTTPKVSLYIGTVSNDPTAHDVTSSGNDNITFKIIPVYMAEIKIVSVKFEFKFKKYSSKYSCTLDQSESQSLEIEKDVCDDWMSGNSSLNIAIALRKIKERKIK